MLIYMSSARPSRKRTEVDRLAAILVSGCGLSYEDVGRLQLAGLLNQDGLVHEPTSTLRVIGLSADAIEQIVLAFRTEPDMRAWWIGVATVFGSFFIALGIFLSMGLILKGAGPWHTPIATIEVWQVFVAGLISTFAYGWIPMAIADPKQTKDAVIAWLIVCLTMGGLTASYLFN